MATIKELNNVFDQAEELVGTSPSAAGLRNAIYAVITQNYSDERFNRWVTPLFRNYVDYLARNYETLRQIHVHLGASCQVTCDTPSK